jgi:cytochrome c553
MAYVGSLGPFAYRSCQQPRSSNHVSSPTIRGEVWTRAARTRDERTPLRKSSSQVETLLVTWQTASRLEEPTREYIHSSWTVYRLTIWSWYVLRVDQAPGRDTVKRSCESKSSSRDPHCGQMPSLPSWYFACLHHMAATGMMMGSAAMISPRRSGAAAACASCRHRRKRTWQGRGACAPLLAVPFGSRAKQLPAAPDHPMTWRNGW